jgi:ribonuclease HI
MSAPHFLLRAECHRSNRPGDWHFALETDDGRRQIDVEDIEPNVDAQRLELLTVVRALEALDHPAEVTLQTSSTYVRRGINYGLEDWRSSDWRWERYGEMVPVKNADLWRRLDRAMQVHNVTCQVAPADAANPNSLPQRRSA